MSNDVFRKNCAELSEEDKDQVRLMKTYAEDLMFVFSRSNINNREMSIAKTKLEEAVMWATKAITAKYYEGAK